MSGEEGIGCSGGKIGASEEQIQHLSLYGVGREGSRKEVGVGLLSREAEGKEGLICKAAAFLPMERLMIFCTASLARIIAAISLLLSPFRHRARTSRPSW